MSDAAAPSVIRGVRRAAIVVVIVSLAIAAALGIVALLAEEFGQTQSQVLLTTLAVAAFSITALCHLAIIGRTVRWVGYLGIAASTAALVPALVLIWADGMQPDAQGEWFKALGTLAVLAASLAQANLLLLLAARRQRAVRLGLALTLLFVAVVAVMIWLPILTEGDIPGDNQDYWRALGVIAILDVLGTIVLPILGLVLRHGAAAQRLALTLPVELAQRLAAAATTDGVSRDAAALAALDRALPPAP